MARRKIVIMGAAGRDFHNFNVLFRGRPEVDVVAFTAAQIPDIDGRRYPGVLAGELYPAGIPIIAETDLETLVRESGIEEAWFSYSDLAYVDVMHKAARLNAWGASFVLASATRTMLKSTKPVIAVTAVRTGVGKSQTTRYLLAILKELGQRVVAVRHPMPYGDLAAQVCQRFATYEDLDRHHCTIEEREEYEPHIDHGFVVYAGVDYEKILREAEKEADVILWDGGNNDTPFYKSDLEIVVVDPHRPGHELTYYPGTVNLLRADVIVINKVDTAEPKNLDIVRANVRKYNPRATVIETACRVTVPEPEAVKGKRVLVVEDGPTLTHGEMPYGAGVVAARHYGASELIDPRPFAQGSIRGTFEKFTHLYNLLPAMG